MKTPPPLFPIPALLVVFCLCAGTTPFHAQSNNGRVKVTGTGRTTGHVITLFVSNPNLYPVEVQRQTCYIPSGGKYQPYIVRIPEGISIPAGGDANIPVQGYCTDVHKPPIPTGTDAPAPESWIVVAHPDDPVKHADISNPIQVQSGQPVETVPIWLIPGNAIPAFTPEMTGQITTSPGYSPVPEDAPNISVTWPGTDVPTDGRLDPGKDPGTFARLAVSAVDRIEAAYDLVRDAGVTRTPYGAAPEKEREAVIQQTFWIYTAALTGQPYERADFSGKVYEQFETSTGKTVASIPAQERSDLDSGVADFWNTFAATGVEAKVLSASSPGLDLSPEVLATVSSPACRCGQIAYRIEVRKGDDVVHAADHTTPDNPRIVFDGFAFGDELSVKILNIRAECNCDDTPCTQYPAESTNKGSPGYTKPDGTRPGKADIEMSNDASDAVSENSNCSNEGKQWNADGSEYSFTLKTRDEGTNQKGVYQRLRIKTYCQTDDCRKALCAKYIYLHFAARAD